MSAKFFDQHNATNPDNGTVVSNGMTAKSLLKRNSANGSIFVELIADNQMKLLIGLGAEICCAQFSTADDDPPYLMATLKTANLREGFTDFLIGKTPSEVPLRLCIPISVLLDVAAYFVETGERSSDVEWEAI